MLTFAPPRLSTLLSISPAPASITPPHHLQLLLAHDLSYTSNGLSQAVTLVAIALVLTAAINIARIYRTLPESHIRKAWLYLGWLLAPAVLGFASFLFFNAFEPSHSSEDWIISLTFFASAVFVFAVCLVSRYTAKDLVRVRDLEIAAYFDALTGLYARAQVIELLELACTRARTLTSPLSVLLLDVDDFKLVNDRYGHAGGDFVLEQLAWLMRESVTAADYVGRYGGEEFLIVLPNTSPVHAERIAERIRSSIAARRFTCDDNRIAISVSIGIATSCTFEESGNELIDAADHALYGAKDGGRNQVRHAGENVQRKEVISINAPAQARTQTTTHLPGKSVP